MPSLIHTRFRGRTLKSDELNSLASIVIAGQVKCSARAKLFRSLLLLSRHIMLLLTNVSALLFV